MTPTQSNKGEHVPTYDIVIKGGTVIDGLRTPRYKRRRRDQGREGCVQIGQHRQLPMRAEVVDASGKIVAPGFVDLHTHYDSQVFWDPWCTMSGWHGVTSVVIGNCGFGFAPCKPEDRDRAMLVGLAQRGRAAARRCGRACRGTGRRSRSSSTASTARRRASTSCRFVPLAPLYGYVVGVDKAKEQRGDRRGARRRCASCSSRAWKPAAAAGARRSSASVGNVQLDYDGTPMVTDQMTEREVIAFAARWARSAAASRR